MRVNARSVCFFLSITLALTVSSVAVSQTEQADYSIHEWGLVRYLTTPEIATSDFGSGVAPEPYDPWDDPYYGEPTVEKPVIYFHPGPDFVAETPIEVTIDLVTATVREVWPTPAAGSQPVHGTSYTWSTVVIEPNQPCSGELAPAIADPACISLFDGVCEAAELSEYVGNVDHCLMVGDPPVQTPVLLYNALLPAFAQPVVMDQSAQTLTNSGQEAVGPVWVILNDSVYTIDSLGAGETLNLETVEAAFPLLGSKAQVTRQILETLMDRGLTLVEAGQFILAWSTNVLNEPFPWHVFGLYSQETVDRQFPLTLSPAPTEAIRVLAFTLE